jgi:diguanylate cyclase (GGDEF)-like protein
MIQNGLARPSRLLTFPSILEAKFEADTKAARLRGMRLLGTTGALMFAAFVYNDMQLPDGIRERIISIRLLDSLLILFLAQFLLRLELRVWLREFLSAATLATVVCSVLYILYVDPNDVGKTIQVSGLIAVMAFGIIVFPSMFRYLAPNAVFLGVIVEIGLFESSLSDHARLSFGMIFFAMLVMALFTAYRQELHYRRDYLRNLDETMRYANLKRDAERLRVWAVRDGMTGAFNRGYFNEQFPRELRRAAREKMPLSLLMIDIDHFKTYNDTFGHVAGDRCLCEVVKVVQRQLKRPADFVARFGGEEFAVVLPGSDLFGASTVADLIQAEIRSLKSANGAIGENFVTVSIGAAAFDPHTDISDWEFILRRADDALYQAKKDGRNRNHVSSEPRQYI